MLHGQTLETPNGSISISGVESREKCVRQIVELAIKDGWKPPSRWAFWKTSCPEDVREEYQRQRSPEPTP